jgi:hypothetical protein
MISRRPCSPCDVQRQPEVVLVGPQDPIREPRSAPAQAIKGWATTGKNGALRTNRASKTDELLASAFRVGNPEVQREICPVNRYKAPRLSRLMTGS